MTRILRVRFRRLVIVAALGAGALGLALGTTAAASAATTGGYPGPSPTPTVTETYPPPPDHHKPEVKCEFSLLTEHDTVFLQDDQKGDQPPVYGDQQYGRQHEHQGDDNGQGEQVEVVQLVKFCVTEGEHGYPDHVKVWDVTGPFAWVAPDEEHGGAAPTPSGLPSVLAPFLAK